MSAGDEPEDDAFDGMSKAASQILNTVLVPEFQKRGMNALEVNLVLQLMAVRHAIYAHEHFKMVAPGGPLSADVPDGLDEEGEPFRGKVP